MPGAKQQLTDTNKAHGCAWRLVRRVANKHSCSERQCRVSAQTHSSLAASQAIARSRAEHSAGSSPLFVDEHAAAVACGAPPLQRPHASALSDVIATHYVDQQLLTALNLVNMDLREEYRQVVLLGCGHDTRPYRLLWPEGTLFFELAPKEVLERSKAILKAQQAHVPRGCLLRQIPCDFEDGHDFSQALERAGYQADRLSVWAVQGLADLGLDKAQLTTLFTHVSLSAAYDSVLFGELPAISRPHSEQLLAEHGMLGRLIRFGSDEANFGLWKDEVEQGAVEGSLRWLFTCQHKQLSGKQENTYTSHVQAAEDTDEDFFGNFS